MNLWNMAKHYALFLGIGIHEKHLSNIFEHFYRIESQKSCSHKGTDIGLALVTQHGDILVESKVNVGTTFRVWIPAGSDHLLRIRFISVPKEIRLNLTLNLKNFIQM